MGAKLQIRNYLATKISRPVHDGEDIFSAGLVDSLFALQLVLFLEKEFQIVVEGEDLDLDNFLSVDAMSAFVARKVEGAAASAAVLD
jgi:acyl carrier protein